MDRMSYREYRTRLAWKRIEFETPSRSDYYLMQIAQEVRRVLHKNPAKVMLDHFLLKFKKNSASSKSDIDKSKMISESKARWFAAVGLDKDGKLKGKLRTSKEPTDKPARMPRKKK